MRKIIFTIILIVFVVVTHAQITLNSNSAYQVGWIINTQPYDASNINLISGANITADLSSVKLIDKPITNTVVSPSSTPAGYLFPTATAALYTLSASGKAYYDYYFSDTTKMELIGTVNPYMVMVYNNPLLSMKFPSNFNDTYEDTAQATYTLFGANYVRTIYSRFTLGTYGNIKTPSGTYPYLRIYSHQSIIDSIFTSGTLNDVNSFETVNYSYMNSDYIAPLFFYSATRNINDTYTGNYLIIPKAGMVETSKNMPVMQVSPNPTNANLYVTFYNNITEDGSLNVYDITGKLTFSAPVHELEKVGNSLVIPTNSMTKGLYFVKYSNTSVETTPIKFVVE